MASEFVNIYLDKVRDLLEKKCDYYNHPSFIEDDPISIPHSFKRKEDKEISALFSATIAWGNRKMIVANAQKLMTLMDHAPFDFVMNAGGNDLKNLEHFKHRTFQYSDLLFFISALRHLYAHHGGMEKVFSGDDPEEDVYSRINRFRELMMQSEHEQRSEKHVSSPAKGSAAKRLNMFLRWMVRDDDKGVDFGLWKNISPSVLMCPLDVHSGRVGRQLGLFIRKQDDWKAVVELTSSLRILDPADPVRFDFALFGMGVSEKAVIL